MKKIFLFLSLLIIFTSCIKMLLRKNGMIEKKAVLQKIQFEDKDILFLGMAHISQQPFYDECKKIIDSLSAKAYFVFGEGVLPEDKLKGNNVSSEQDTINSKKMRKILGIDPAFYGKSEVFITFSKKYQFVEQPFSLYGEICKKDSSLGKFVDYTSKKLINVFEKSKGEVILEDCDKKTLLGEEYKCTGLEKEKRKFFIDEIASKMRNELIVKELKESKHQKILIVYGENHYKGIQELLGNVPIKNKK